MDIAVLAKSILLLFLLMLPGFVLKKVGFITESAGKSLSNIVLYVASPAMFVLVMIRPYDQRIMLNIVAVFVISLLIHGFSSLIASFLFRRAPETKRNILIFASVFSNAGFFGLPLILAVLGEEAAIYTAVYAIGFNVFSWSFGCYLYTEDRKYISPRHMFLNAATIPFFVGLIFFVLPIDGYFPPILTEFLEMLEAVIAPLSMIVIGVRLAEIRFRSVFSDGWMFLCLAVRMLIFPLLAWGLVRIMGILGIYSDTLLTNSILILSSTPFASATVMFAEKFDRDAVYASKLVALSTFASILTMPLIALLANI